MRTICVTVLLCVQVTTGCATVGGFASQPLDRGEAWHYDRPFDQIVTAVRETFDKSETRVATGWDIEDIRAIGTSWMMVVTETGGFLADQGDLVRIVVNESPADGVTVRPRSKAISGTNTV